MPELPEVETVASELRKSIIGKQIIDIEALWMRSFVNNSETEANGQKIISIERRGKYLILNLEKSYIVIHLRMTGQLLYFDKETGADLNDYIRVIIKFQHGVLLFKDVRKFGRVYHSDNADKFLAHVGIDALDKDLSAKHFSDKLKPSKMSIKAFLMAQKFISGMGNIYTDEVLYLSKLHPSITACELSKKKAAILFTNMQFVLNSSIKNMGSTISDYRDPAGNKGNNQHYFYVYGRNGKECKKCGSTIKKIKFAGRGTHFCPNCQKINKYKTIEIG